MKYYIIEQEKITKYLPLMEQSFGHTNISVSMNLDESVGLMQFTDELAPKGYTSYTNKEIQDILRNSQWSEQPTLTDEEKIYILIKYGKELVVKFQIDNTALIREGSITEIEAAQLIYDQDVQAVTTALLAGTLRGAAFLIQTRFLDASGESVKPWVTKERIVEYLTTINNIISNI